MVTVSNFTPNGILTMEGVKDNLMNEETIMKEKGESLCKTRVNLNFSEKWQNGKLSLVNKLQN